MAKVEILKLNNDGTQKVIAVCSLKGEEVVCTGDEEFVLSLSEQGIEDYTASPPRKIFPKDGRIFLEQLKFNFKSGYLNATEVKEE